MDVNCSEAKGRKKILIPLHAPNVLRDVTVWYLALPDTLTVLEKSLLSGLWFPFLVLVLVEIWSCLLPSFPEFI